MTPKRSAIIERVLLLLLVCSFFFPLTYNPNYIKIYPFDLVLLPIIALRILSLSRNWQIRATYPSIAIFLFATWILLTSSYAHLPALAVEGGLLWLRAAFLFHIFYAGFDRVYTSREVVRIICVVVLIQGTLMIIQGMSQTSIGALNQYFGTKEMLANYRYIDGDRVLRAQGTLSNPNTVASWIVVLVAFLIGQISKINKQKFWILLSTVIGSTSIFFTYSRGAILILALILIFHIINLKREIITETLLTGTLGALISLIALSYQGLPTTGSITQRIDQLQIAAELISHSPLKGVGYNNFVAATEVFTDREFFFRGDRSGVHNFVALIFSEAGVIGIALLSLFLIPVYRFILGAGIQGWEERPIMRGGVFALLALLAIMQIYSTVTSFQFLPLALSFMGIVYGAVGSTRV